jgi:signal transduction histidine kinase
VSERAVIDDPLFRHTIRVDPIAPFEAAAVGITTFQVDPDGTVRRARLLFPDMPSFAFQAVRRYLENRDSQHIEAQFLTGKKRLLSDPDREVLINYLGPPRTVKTVSYYQALDYERMLPPGIFADKIVLIGRALEAAPEPQRTAPNVFRTPFSLIVAGPTPGVEIHATIVNNILAGHFVTTLTPAAQLGLLMGLALVGSLVLLKCRLFGGLAATLTLALLFLVIATGVFARRALWLPTFAGTLQFGLVYVGHLVVQSLSAERERRLALEAVNRDLEEQVRERTAALYAANQELRERHQELEKAYQELSRSQDQLIQSEKMASLGLLVAGIAHELNNPISFIHSNMDFIGEYVERLREVMEAYEAVELPSGSARSRVEELKKRVRLDTTLQTLDELIVSCKHGTERVKKIVMDLRTFSRSDDVGPVRVDLHEVLETTLNLLTKEYKDRITIHREYGDLPKVECHPGQMNQVFMNPLLNASQATPSKGDVWLKTASRGARVTITIKDNGCGIPETDLPKIFDPFFTTKKVGEGTGLGLSITYGIIEKHRGSIHVSSQVGKGTEFTVELPVRMLGG